MARTRRRVAAVTLWAALLLALGATQVWAQTGAISGTVTREAGGAGVQSVLVNAYLNGSGFPYAAVTNAAGAYTISSLSPGTYYLVSLSFVDVVDELYPNTPCPDTLCTLTSGTPIVVSSGATTGNINLALAAGAVITGTVTTAATAAPVSGVSVRAYNTSGTSVGSWSSNASGVYQLHAVPAGTYYARTFASGQFPDELYDNHPCSPSCTVTSGTPIVGVGGGSNTVDFALGPGGGTISGSVTDAVTAAGLNEVTVAVYRSTGAYVRSANTNNGTYSVSDLAPGTYFVRTNVLGASRMYFDELYDNLPCNTYVQNCTIFGGTPILVTGGGTTTVNFALTKGGRIHGTVTNSATGLPLANVSVTVNNVSASAAVSYLTGADGVYWTDAMPAGNYYALTWNNPGYVSEVYADIPCFMACAPMSGTPIAVTTGLTTSGIDFALTPGGQFSGRVSNVRSGNSFYGMPVRMFEASGVELGTTSSDISGTYLTPALPPGTYYARTDISTWGTFADEVYQNLPCLSDCTPSTGTPIVVSPGTVTSLIDFALEPSLVWNGHFGVGTSGWSLWAAPNTSDMVSAVVNGVFEFSRAQPPPGTTNQAVIFQNTGAAVDAASPLVAQFELGNSSNVRKRISVLLLDSDFSDLSVCTFWLAAHAPLRAYRMFTHTTKAWTNASIYFYAASAGQDGGAYRLDNVLVYNDPSESATQTRCVDPTSPLPPGGADGPVLLTNGDFEAGSLAPWTTFGTITTQFTGGVLEFTRPASTPPAGVVLQSTNQTMAGQQLVTASFSLGNSSGVRKRVTVLLHDLDFSDLAACTLWLPPGQPLSTYVMRTFATKAWANATLSVYPATTGVAGWIQLDDVTLQRTPGVITSGTDCIEPGPGGRAPVLSASVPAGSDAYVPVPASSLGRGPDTAERASGWSRNAGGTWGHDATGDVVTMAYLEGLDLRTAVSAVLRFTSELEESAAGEIQVRANRGPWLSLYPVPGIGHAEQVEVDLAGVEGGIADIRFVQYAGGRTLDTGDQARWRITDVAVDVR